MRSAVTGSGQGLVECILTTTPCDSMIDVAGKNHSAGSLRDSTWPCATVALRDLHSMQAFGEE
jgi:hypothetical protein